MDRLVDDWAQEWVDRYAELYPVTNVHKHNNTTYLFVGGNIGVALHDPTRVDVTYPSEAEGVSLFSGSPQSAADFVEWLIGYHNGY